VTRGDRAHVEAHRDACKAQEYNSLMTRYYFYSTYKYKV
jgi:hypothetical protein